jgi:hypothetical protein
MTSHEEIKAWLDSEEKDFEAGYTLFVRFSHNRALALQIARKRLLTKLEYELEKIYKRKELKDSPVMPIGPVKKALAKAEDKETGVQQAGVIVEAAAGKVKIIKGGRIQYEDLPEELKKLYDENTDRYKRMRARHEQMKIAQTPDARAQRRSDIDYLDDGIAANWKVIDDWAAGKLNLDDLKKNDADKEVYKQINAARTYISREVKKVAKLEGEKRKKKVDAIIERIMILKKHNAKINDKTLQKLIELEIMDLNGNPKGK